jgi:hypothetical protein
VDLKNGSRAQERTYLLDRQTNSPTTTTVSFLNIPCQGFDYSVNLPIEADVQQRSIHLGQVNSFTEVLRSILQVLCKIFNIKANSKNDESRQALSLWAQSDTQVLVVLQEVLRSNSLAKRTKAEKLSQRGSIISAKRTNMDEDILTKAQRLAAKHNLEISELSFVPLDPKIITSNCEKIRISLGSNETHVLQSVVAIKNIEIDRLMVAAKSLSPYSVDNFNVTRKRN